MDRSKPGLDPESGPSVSEVRPADAASPKTIGVECSEAPPEAKTRTFTYEVQHDTELYVYFSLLEAGKYAHTVQISSRPQRKFLLDEQRKEWISMCH
ncbi:hypothetical protein Mapa_000205 [Marchantia paleacea]|nr:hypothetical protein Mapa_000205 [Marchantia paleacea]